MVLSIKTTLKDLLNSRFIIIYRFAAQMDVAYRTHMPVMIHSRDACQDTIDILKSNHEH